MPYTLRKVKKRRCYSVKNLKKNKTFAKCTSKRKAKKQINLLRALQYNKSFKPNLRRKLTNGGTRKNLKKMSISVKNISNDFDNANKIKDDIENKEKRPLHITEFEKWYEVIANQELNSQIPYLDYLDKYRDEHSY